MIKFNILFFFNLKLYVYIQLCINFALTILCLKKNRNDFEICKRKTFNQKRLLTCYYHILPIE